MDFVMKEKTEEAKRFLWYSDKSFIVIGAYLGFLSPGHFSRVFKKYAGWYADRISGKVCQGAEIPVVRLFGKKCNGVQKSLLRLALVPPFPWGFFPKRYYGFGWLLRVQHCLSTVVTLFRAFRADLPGYHTFLSLHLPAAFTTCDSVQLLGLDLFSSLTLTYSLLCGFCSSGQRFARG